MWVGYIIQSTFLFNRYNPYNMYNQYNPYNMNDNVSHNTVDNVSYNVVDSLEDKHKKTEKLLKLGIALFLGGI